MLRYIHGHQAELLPLAPIEIARVAELWLKYVPKDAPLRREAAELGLMLGERARIARDGYRGVKNRNFFYQAALAGAGDLPDEVAAFALKASERTIEKDEVEDTDDYIPKIIRCIPLRSDEHVPEPWRDGPRARVDMPSKMSCLTLQHYCH